MKDYSTAYSDVITEINNIYTPGKLRKALIKNKRKYSRKAFKDIMDLINESDKSGDNISYDDLLLNQENGYDIIVSIHHIPLKEILTAEERRVFLLRVIYKNIQVPKDSQKDCIEKVKSYAEIGRMIGLNAKRVERIYKGAIRKLLQSEDVELCFSENISSIRRKQNVYPYADNMVSKNNCTLMQDLNKSFCDERSVCPGRFDNYWNELICEKRREKPDCKNCNMKKCNLSVKEYSTSNLAQSTVSKYCKEGVLPCKKVGNRYEIDCKSIGNCGQHVFNKRLTNKYRLDTKGIKAWNKLQRLINMWIRQKQSAPKNGIIGTDKIAEEINKQQLEFMKYSLYREVSKTHNFYTYIMKGKK